MQLPQWAKEGSFWKRNYVLAEMVEETAQAELMAMLDLMLERAVRENGEPPVASAWEREA